MKVIAISGWKRSGKDTAADHLVKKHGFHRVAFADVLKDMVAEEYNIPRTSCDDPARKEVALLQYPVNPQDAFSTAIANLMLGEFRTAAGKRSVCLNYRESAMAGEQLYWTPRALCIFKGSGNRSVTSQYWTQRAIQEIHSKAQPFVEALPEPYEYHDGSPLVGKIKESGNFVISDLRFNSEIHELRQAFGDQLVTVRVNRFDTCESTDASERDLDEAYFDVVLENRSTLEDFLKGVDTLRGL